MTRAKTAVLTAFVVLLLGCGELRAVGNVVPDAKNRMFWERLVSVTVRISTSDGWGSGVLISGGRVLTAHHVIDKDSSVRVFRTKLMPDGKFRAGLMHFTDVIGSAPVYDLALLKIRSAPADLPAAPLGDSSRLRRGDLVYRLGWADDVWMTYGRVGNLNFVWKGGRYFELKTVGGDGNSGGPVFNAKGEVVGIAAVAGCLPGGWRCRYPNYAVPINYARETVLRP